MINGDECLETVSLEITRTKIHKSKLYTNLLKRVDFRFFSVYSQAIFIDFVVFFLVFGITTINREKLPKRKHLFGALFIDFRLHEGNLNS